jgi:hypothetical protein
MYNINNKLEHSTIRVQTVYKKVKRNLWFLIQVSKQLYKSIDISYNLPGNSSNRLKTHDAEQTRIL